MNPLRHDVRSTVAFVIFPSVYLARAMWLAHSYFVAGSDTGAVGQHQAAEGLTVGFLLFETLLATLGHAVAFGLIRWKVSRHGLPILIPLQVVIALACLAILRHALPLFAVFLVPALVTLAVYVLARLIEIRNDALAAHG